MSSSVVIGVNPSNVDQIQPTDVSKLKSLKENLQDLKTFVESHKQGLANIGQIAGTALVVMGLITAGTPLGIPLLVTGSCLFATGTAFQIMHHIEKTDMDVGNKIKGILKETLANLTFGSLTGVAISAVSAAIPLKYLIPIIGVAIKYKSFMAHNPFETEGWEKCKQEWEDNNAQKSIIDETIIESDSFNGFITKIMENMKKVGSDTVEAFNESTAAILFEKIPNTAKEFISSHIVQTAMQD